MAYGFNSKSKGDKGYTVNNKPNGKRVYGLDIKNELKGEKGYRIDNKPNGDRAHDLNIEAKG